MTEVIVWNGWLGGLAVGLYGLLQFWTTGYVLGVSTGFGNVCYLVTKENFFNTGGFENKDNWRLWFLLGIPLGGFLAALFSPGEILVSMSLGEMYDSVLPTNIWLKISILFLGGIFIGLGSRLAGGCTSGHSISGMAMLNPPSFVASIGYFIGGILIVQLLFNFF